MINANPSQSLDRGSQAEIQEARSLTELLKARLSSSQRQQALIQLKSQLSSQILLRKALVFDLIREIIEQGPNDSRRIAFQVMQEVFRSEQGSSALNPLQYDLSKLIGAILSCVNRCLKVKSQSTSSDSASLSATRTAAAAIKALHSLLLLSSSVPSGADRFEVSASDLTNILETLLATMYHGISSILSPAQGPGPGSHWRSEIISSSLAQARFPNTQSVQRSSLPSSSRRGRGITSGALAFGSLPSIQPISSSISNSAGHTRTNSSSSLSSVTGNETYVNKSEEASAVGGQSESEEEGWSARDFSDNGGDSGSGAPSPRKEPEQQILDARRIASAAQAVRQNSISCIIVLNQKNHKALYSYWPSLLPDSDIHSAFVTKSSLTVSRIEHGISASVPRPALSLFSIIENDPSISTRIKAVELVENLLQNGRTYLSIAQERPSSKLTAFTSLSSRLAALIVDLRSHILGMLHRCIYASTGNNVAEVGEPGWPSPSSLTEALLKLAKTYLQNTSGVKLKQSNSELLQPLISKACMSKDPTIAAAAYSALSALISGQGRPNTCDASAATRSAATLGSGLGQISSASDSSIVPGILSRLTDVSLSSKVKAEAWNTIAACAESRHADIKAREADILKLVHECLGHSVSAEVRHASASFILATVKAKVSSKADGRDPQGEDEKVEVVDGNLDQLDSILGMMCCDDAASVRMVAADALADWNLVRFSGARGGCGLTKDLILQLCGDHDPGVRAAGIRSIGLILGEKRSLFTSERSAKGAASRDPSFITEALLGSQSAVNQKPAIRDSVAVVRNRAAWTLANWCEALFGDGGISDPDFSQPFQSWQTLLEATLEACDDEDQISVHALRASGFLLFGIRPEWLEPEMKKSLAFIHNCIKKLRLAVTKGRSPKTRWNAASSLAKAMENEGFLKWICQGKSRSLLDDIVGSLGEAVKSKTFKVKILASQALLSIALGSKKAASSRAFPCDSVPDPALDSDDQSCASSFVALPYLDEEMRRVTAARIEEARSKLEQEISNASFNEVKLHGQSCRENLDELWKAFCQ
ncbi:hypothetical protein IE53DRAFT_234775 [Violaceomyces palustris]|uniref:Uncharacterized protein n=1 Tax=Violaceomyces palustris TaxID=1673888 RepID=A0ACD0P4F1_9BASI|nr:hypothetical protein IE53DRAFT_234775 [Violaceomyces palustris]